MEHLSRDHTPIGAALLFSPTEAKRRSLTLSNAASAHTANKANVLTEIRAPLIPLTEQETETEQRLSSGEYRDGSWQRGERKERGGEARLR